MVMKSQLTVFYLLVVAIFHLFASASGGASVTLRWDANPETDVVGYRVYYGTSSGNYPLSLDAGNVTTAAVTDLAEGQEYYFAVTAVNAASLESLPSEEVSVVVSAATSASVVARLVFYNDSAWDGYDSGINAADDQAIAADKAALLPGQVASFLNYTSFDLGLNGIMVDINGLGAPAEIGASDFVFRSGNTDEVSTWEPVVQVPMVEVREGAGTGGSDRVTITFPNEAILKTWLEVTVLPTQRTGLAEPDTFYFGNAVGETGSDLSNAVVNSLDELRIRVNGQTSGQVAAIGNLFDVNRDKVVNAFDEVQVRVHNTNSQTMLRMIDLSPSPTQSLQTQPLAASGSSVPEGDGTLDGSTTSISAEMSVGNLGVQANGDDDGAVVSYAGECKHLEVVRVGGDAWLLLEVPNGGAIETSSAADLSNWLPVSETDTAVYPVASGMFAVRMNCPQQYFRIVGKLDL
ncbi:MAG: fibronectin type III domain-containing protein [Verrucomicrobiae bacterium]|nr:fibronectin type III domain-containing protein [Verrucomicrobiae bacterium]